MNTESLIQFGILLCVMTAWGTVFGLAGAVILRFANWIAGIIDKR